MRLSGSILSLGLILSFTLIPTGLSHEQTVNKALGNQKGDLIAQLDPVNDYSLTADEVNDFLNWMEHLKQLAIAQGYSAGYIVELLANIERPLTKIITSDQNQADRITTPLGYLSKLDLPQRWRDLQLSQERQEVNALLDLVAGDGRPPAAIIFAIWSLETSLGKIQGNYRVLEALATLSWQKRRREYFTREFIAALSVLAKTELAVDSYRGSWAGAAGPMQMMPSNILVYGADGDQDGIINPISSTHDAFASAVNMLRQQGWRRSEPWGWRVQITSDFNWQRLEQSHQFTQWQEYGVMPVATGLPSSNQKLQLKAPFGSHGPGWLVGHNYRRILNWNRSELYALSVGILTDLITNRLQDNEISDLPGVKQITRAQLFALQENLQAAGFYQGKVDGKFGRLTTRAIRDWQSQNGQIADGVLLPEALETLTRSLN